MGFINCLNTNSGVITAGATVVLAVITGYYVRLTNRLLKITTDTPKIAIYLEDINNDDFTMLCVENIGTGPAYDVRFDGDFSLKLYNSEQPEELALEDVGFLSLGIDYLQPGGKRKCKIDIRSRLDTLKETPLKITVTYKDSKKKKSLNCFSLNFGELINSSYIAT